MTIRSIIDGSLRVLNTPLWGTVRNRRARSPRDQGGFVYLFALFAVILMVAGTLVVLEKGATEARRRREEEMIWRGNQYVRAIRMYYKKTGHYPQTLDDLNKGLPQLHFLRQPFKDPTNTTDGSWRFIYINGAGQIIGSTKYANLQQMALMDQNGGQLPVIPGQPGQSVTAIAQQQAGIDPNTGQPMQQNGQLMNQNNTQPQYGADGSTGTVTDAFGNQVATVGEGQAPPPPTNQSIPNLPAGLANITPEQIQSAIQSGQLPPGVSAADVQNFLSTGQIPANIDPAVVSAVQSAIANAQSSGNGQLPSIPTNNNPSQGGLFGITGQPGVASAGPASGLAGSALAGAALGGGQMNLAAMAMLKPTGPVDGPVLGGFLTGVAGKTDADSIKKYHGAKKLKDFEFIWNPLEDAAAALQNQLGGTQGNILGQGSSSSSPNGASSFGIGGLTSPNLPQQTPQQNPQQQSPPSTPQQ